VKPVWDPEGRRFTNDSVGGAITLPDTHGEVTIEPEALAGYGSDFGRIVHEPPAAVLRAASAEDVAIALQFCQEHAIPVVARAFGQSGHGQAQGRGALAIDLRALDRVVEISEDRLTVGAAITWRSLMHAAAEKGVAAPVFTNHLDVSVGGSITVGGVGIASHRYGLQSDNIAELEVATTEGKVVRCSSAEKPELFHAVLAGLGQFGFVTQVTIHPIALPSRVATLRLVYADASTLLADLSRFARQNRFDTLDNRIIVPPDGGPCHRVIDLGLFLYQDEEAPDLRALAGKTRGTIESSQEVDYRAYMHRDDEHVHFVGTVLAQMAKPWCVYILPDSALDEFVTQGIEPLLTPERGAIAVFAHHFHARLARSMSLPLPDVSAGWFTVVGVIRVAPPPAVPHILEEHRVLFERALAAGGGVYPYGSVPLTPADWRRLLGSRWETYVALKHIYDPKGILNPSYGIDASA
jgi:cytokinin dehydrogenase